jgi:hypothetical protein
LSNQEQDDVPHHHREGEAFVFDPPENQREAARRRREDQQHEFARSQVNTNARLALFTGALVLATFCTIVVGIWQACIYGRQLRAMQGQLTQMQGTSAQTNQLICLYQEQLAQMRRQSLAMEDSAEAAVDQAEAVTQSEMAHFEIDRGAAIVKNGQPIRLPFTVQNTGKTDATDVVFKSVAVFIENDRDPSFSYTRKGVFRASAPLWTPGMSLSTATHVPEISVGVRNPDGTLVIADAEMEADYMSGKKDVVGYGRISYRDYFGKEHWFDFCGASQVFHRDMSSRHHKCTSYNKTDSNRVINQIRFDPPMPPMSPETPCPIK